MLGTDAVFRWATLLVMTGFGDCPRSYLELALQRARICELLAAKRRIQDTVPFYTAGLLSLLDSMIRSPMPDILAPLPLSESIRQALEEPRTGDAGEILSLVLSWEAAQSGAGERLDTSDLQHSFWEGVVYARTMLLQLQAAPR